MSKVAGIIICVGGAMSMALLKGQKLLNIKLVPQILVFSLGGESSAIESAIDSCGGEIGNEDVVYQSENDKSSFNNSEDCSGGNGGGGGIKNGRVHDSEAVNYAVPYRASTPARSRTWRLEREGMIEELVDVTIGSYPQVELLNCVRIGLMCCQESMQGRPLMSSVVLMLSSDSITAPLPGSRDNIILGSTSTDSSSIVTDNFSNNSVTLSLVSGR
ncbi:hypothetical protein GIB67_040744 [Kingdonia uniflora]|uniref:Uncharacterized protein n=1 Tax=Kingdonia uniflora TaxID=39325 RepID=A0A7J7KUE0_9MAGN|nr:hypothetical protein GIB67_040744 [Kingdonia uniflora]